MDGVKKTLSAVISIFIILAFGVGGYFLGWYLDKQAAAKADSEMSGVNLVYTDSDFKFSYPRDWNRVTSSVSGNTKKIFTTSPNGSEFGYLLDTQAGTTYSVCDTKTPNGNNKIIKKCTFVTGTPEIARYIVSTTGGVTEWRVAEKDGTIFVSKDSKTFYYKAKSDADLVILDKIMKSVVKN